MSGNVRFLPRPARSALARAVGAYHEALLGDDRTLDYLESRGVVFEDVVKYQLGVVAEPAPDHAWMRGRLSIPYNVPLGGPISCKFRCLRDHDCKLSDCPKYLGVEGAGAHPYNVGALRTDSDVIAITEGELDAVVATEAGIPAVAIPGVKAWRDHYVYMFEGFPRVLVFGDADDAGKGFAKRLVEDIPGARAIYLPDGDDVSSFVATYGAEALIERCT